MKLLLVHRYIRPDSPGYAHMLYLIGRRLAEEGHEVTIFSAQPGYNDAYRGPKLPRKEQVDGMTVIRTPLLKENKKSSIKRSLNFLIFVVSLWWHAICRIKPYEKMTVTTFPPTLMGMAARVIRFTRGTKYFYHCMDLYPEIAQASGILKRPWVGKIASWIDRTNCENAEKVIVLSDDMMDTVRDRGVRNPNVIALNNFIIDEVDSETKVSSALQNQDRKFRVLFAGNLGRFQSLETIIAAAHRLRQQTEIEFLFVGSGVMVDELKRMAGPLLGKSVHFHPYMPIKEVMSVIADSQLGIVSLQPKIIESAYPSKTMSYLEGGCKLLVLVERESDLADLVEFESLGVVCDHRTGENVAKAIESQFQQWKDGKHDRERIQAVGRQHFGQDVILDRWAELVR